MILINLCATEPVNYLSGLQDNRVRVLDVLQPCFYLWIETGQFKEFLKSRVSLCLSPYQLWNKWVPVTGLMYRQNQLYLWTLWCCSPNTRVKVKVTVPYSCLQIKKKISHVFLLIILCSWLKGYVLFSPVMCVTQWPKRVFFFNLPLCTSVYYVLLFIQVFLVTWKRLLAWYLLCRHN